MKKVKVMSIFGTRPEAAKMGPLIKMLEISDNIECRVLVTAQHRNMLDQMLEIFNIVPDYDLNIMQDSQTLTSITTRALVGIEGILKTAKPDLILVHGDTTTTFAASLAAFYAQIRVGHVEAGLRTYDRYQPYPEEMNRMLTTSLADLYFAPTKTAKKNLLKENICEEKIFVTGNTAIDCLKYSITENYKFKEDILNDIDFDGKRILTVTAHRRENLGKPLRDICGAIKRIAEEFDDVIVVYAVHLNPVVQETVREALDETANVILTDPLNMADMHNLMKRSYLILSDSGGLQEEAPAMDKPVIVLRNVTERPEGLKTGAMVLAGSETENIYKEAYFLLTDSERYDKMSKAKNPFGDGNAAERIVNSILYSYGFIKERPADFTS